MYDIVSLSGGGPNGAYMLGALNVLKNKKIVSDVHTYVGSSIGSLIAAICISDKKFDATSTLLQTIETEKILSIDVDDFLTKFGMISSDKLKTFISVFIDYDMTFKEMYDTYHQKLVVCVTCLNTFSEEYFSVDTHPGMCIGDAIRMSCSIPLIFDYVEHDNKFYVDGGLTQVIPLSYLETVQYTRCLCLCFDFVYKPIESFEDYMYCIIQSCIQNKKTNYKDLDILKLRSDVDTGDSMSIYATPENIRDMYTSGEVQTVDFLKKIL